jgi:dTDP-4-amino-4,6-dideoxygalactose transaminase
MSAAGRPMIPIAKPVMGDAEVEAAARVIRSGWVTQGPEVAAFEREFAAAVGAAHAVATSSATTALHLALLAAGVRPGDEVVTVSHSFIATANVVRYCGAMPVFVDVEPGTFNMDPARVEQALSPRTRAILCVHQVGMPCDLAAILRLARARDLRVVEDAACAVGSEIRLDGRWERVGRPHGDLACFSFHPRKLVATGDGGMITTASADVAASLRLLRQHGMNIPDTARHAAAQVAFESYPVLGFNYRMTDIQAAIGLVQLAKIGTMVERRRLLADRYAEALCHVEGLILPDDPMNGTTNYQSYSVSLTERFPLARDALMQRLQDAGISTRRGVMAAHREPAFAGVQVEPLPNTDYLTDNSIILPLYHQMTEADIERVATAVVAAAS